MIELRSEHALEEFRQKILSSEKSEGHTVRVCTSTGCRALGSKEVRDRLVEALEDAGMSDGTRVIPTGCRGLCELGPLINVEPEGIAYHGVTVEKAPEMVAKTIARSEVVEELLYKDPTTGQLLTNDKAWPFYSKQIRRVLGMNGEIDPTQIEDYILRDGYDALNKALWQMKPEQVIEEVKASGLRGRGGAGFPTALKWQFCRDAQGEPKYVICNADEGDPGAFMDRSILESNPHSVIEGMIIGAYAIGASYGYVYIRNEYPLAVHNLEIALDQARQHCMLGDNILGSGFDFEIGIRIGSGAFVCGEETALMASIEGEIGEPRPRPPYPAQSGLWGKPTNINNVKSWTNVPLIIRNGSDWFADVGTESSKGTMIFSLVGKVRNTGLVEVPMGITLQELIYDIGGGIPGDKDFKAAQIGGPSGGCIPKEHLSVAVDYESLSELGAIVGSGGLVVCDEDTCMVDLARYFLKFTQEESCGKCIPCRVGTRAMLETLECICSGEGQEKDLDFLIELSEAIKRSSLCGLGQTAPNPVLTTIRYFRDEYEAHIHEKTCPAKVCTNLITYQIVPDRCPGCMVCARNCSVSAISGEKGQPHQIDADICTRCGVCKSLCKFESIVIL